MLSFVKSRKHTLTLFCGFVLLALSLRGHAIYIPVYINDVLTPFRMYIPKGAGLPTSLIHVFNSDSPRRLPDKNIFIGIIDELQEMALELDEGEIETTRGQGDDNLTELELLLHKIALASSHSGIFADAASLSAVEKKVLVFQKQINAASKKNVLLGRDVWDGVFKIASSLDAVERAISDGQASYQYSELLPDNPQIFFSHEEGSFVSRFEGDIKLEPLHVDMEAEQQEHADADFGLMEGTVRAGRITVRMKVYTSSGFSSVTDRTPFAPVAVAEFVFQRNNSSVTPLTPLVVNIFNPNPIEGFRETLGLAGREIWQRVLEMPFFGYSGHCRSTKGSIECGGYQVKDKKSVGYRTMMVTSAMGSLSYLAGVTGIGGAAAVLAATGGAYIQQNYVRDHSALSLAVQELLTHILAPAQQSFPISINGILIGDIHDRKNAVIRHRPTPACGLVDHPTITPMLRKGK